MRKGTLARQAMQSIAERGLSALAEKVLAEDPFSGHLFVFRGRRGDLIKVIWFDGQGACLFSKRLEKGCFVWPSPADGKISVTPAQLAMLLGGIDWRMPKRTWRPLTVSAIGFTSPSGWGINRPCSMTLPNCRMTPRN